MHAIHVDLAWEGLSLSCFSQVCVLVLEQGHFDLNLSLFTPFIDGLGKTKESWVSASRFFWDEALMSVVIPSFDAALV